MSTRPPYRVSGSFALPAVEVGRLFLHGDVEALCHVVREGDPQSAWYAAELLGDLGNPAAADTLLWCLEAHGDGVILLCKAAVRALGQLGESRARLMLTELLREYANSDERDAALQALGELGDPRAVAPLLDTIGGGGSETALTALGRIGDVRAVAGILERWDRMWSYPEFAAAAGALGELGDPSAIPALASLAEERMGPDVRLAAVMALGRVDDSGAIEPLIGALADGDEHVAQAAAEALGARPRALPRLLQALRAPGALTRGGAARALGRLRDASAMEQLGRVLASDPDALVRRTAATALGDLEAPEAVPALLVGLADADAGDAAATALAKLPEPPVTVVSDLLSSGTVTQRRAAATALGQFGTSALIAGSLVRALGDPIRACADRLLTRLRHSVASMPPTLWPCSWPTRKKEAPCVPARHALGLLGETAIVDDLVHALSDDVEAGRLRAAEALGRIGDERTVSPLSEAARHDPDREVRSASVEALGSIGRPASAALVSLLDVGLERAKVIDALGRTGDGVAADALGRFVSEQDKGECLAAVRALTALMDPRAVEPLKRTLSFQVFAGFDEIQETALDGLSRLDDRSAVEAILDGYHNKVASHQATRAALNAIARRRPDLSWLPPRDATSTPREPASRSASS